MFKFTKLSIEIFLSYGFSTNLYIKNIFTTGYIAPRLDVKFSDLLKDINRALPAFIKGDPSEFECYGYDEIPLICSLPDYFPTAESEAFENLKNPFVLFPLFDIKTSDEPEIEELFRRDKHLNRIYKEYDNFDGSFKYHFVDRSSTNINRLSLTLNRVEIFTNNTGYYSDSGSAAYFIFYNDERKCYVLYLAAFILEYENAVRTRILNAFYYEYSLNKRLRCYQGDLFFVLTIYDHNLTKGIHFKLKDSTTGKKSEIILKLDLEEEIVSDDKLIITLNKVIREEEEEIVFEIDRYLSGKKINGESLQCKIRHNNGSYSP
ncbi:hypothetical protein CDIK_1669 [Cucumispora dikerogammari]|nr:hypothetical protein CDIK_1669 [Cucumispora dikerogammari]